MKSFIVLAVIISVTIAAKYSKPLEEQFKDFANEPNINLITDEDERPPSSFSGDLMQAKITSQNINNGNGKFSYNFETQNGINVASIGKLKNEKTFVVSGSYSYTGADGKKYRVRYTADEFGYHPVTGLDEVEPVQPIFIQNTATSFRNAKQLEQPEFDFNTNFNVDQANNAQYNSITNIGQEPVTSQRFDLENFQASLNGPSAEIPSYISENSGQGVIGSGPTSITSLTADDFGQGNVQANEQFSPDISSYTSQQLVQDNVQSNLPLSEPFSDSDPNSFGGYSYDPPTTSAPVISRTYLPQQG